MVLHRHPCGIIYSQAFVDHLADKQQREGAQHVGELLSLDYVRCASGPHAGSSWYQLTWIAAASVPLADRFKIGSTLVAIHKQTRNGLKRGGLHCVDGEVRVLA